MVVEYERWQAELARTKKVRLEASSFLAAVKMSYPDGKVDPSCKEDVDRKANELRREVRKAHLRLLAARDQLDAALKEQST